MAIKNRPTLKQQFTDFINRVPPFDGDPLIQKAEHDQVSQDLFDSLIAKSDNNQSINSPSALIDLDYTSFDLYTINSSASVDVSFTITLNNVSTGQVARVAITKKSNDVYSFSNAVIANIGNVSQTGTTISFFVHNIGGVLVAFSDRVILKSDNISDNISDQLATSKAVNDLNALLSSAINDVDVDLQGQIDSLNSLKADKDQGAWNMLLPVGGWQPGGDLAWRTDQFGMTHIHGIIVNPTGTATTTVATGLPAPTLTGGAVTVMNFPMYNIAGAIREIGVSAAGELVVQNYTPIIEQIIINVSYRSV